uniref:Uncharacterized protein n=1 Tax=Vitis vinifera TaxID=29760 RepID=F6I5M9_VITVI
MPERLREVEVVSPVQMASLGEENLPGTLAFMELAIQQVRSHDEKTNCTIN